MSKKNKYTIKEIVENLQQINEVLKNDVRVVHATEFGSYFVAFCFFVGFCVLSLGVTLEMGWNILIGTGGCLIALAFFILWLKEQ